MVFSFPFSLEGKKQRFRFDNQPLFVISPIKSIPFHSSIFQGIICGQLRGSLTFDEDHLRSILGIIYGLGIICGWGSFAVLYYFSQAHHLLRFLRFKTNYKDWEFFAHGDCIHDQNIPLDHPTNPTSLVCKRPQAQFQTNLCAVTVSTDFATMNLIVYRSRFHVKRVFTNPTAMTTTRFWHNVYAYIARFFLVNARESAFSSTRHCLLCWRAICFFFPACPFPPFLSVLLLCFFAFQDNSHDQWNSELPLKNASAG